jgi:hypothetical protein
MTNSTQTIMPADGTNIEAMTIEQIEAELEGYKPGNIGEQRRISVYRYGLLGPLDWGDDCEEELRRMTALWNRLVEIEHAHRAQVRALTAADEAVAAAEAKVATWNGKIKALYDQRAALRKEARARTKTTDLDDEIAQAKRDRREASTIAKEARRRVRADAKDKLAELNEQRKGLVKTARQQSGLYWGNYNAVCADYDRARSAAMNRGVELKFHRHCTQPGEGMSSARVVNQIQGGMTPDELVAGRFSQAAIVLVGPQAPLLRVTVHRRDGNRTVTWPICQNKKERLLPDDARIQEVIVTRRAVADSWQWSVSFLLRLPQVLPSAGEATACGIDLGWRRVNDGLRVATVAHADGSHEFITLPDIFLRRLNRIEALAGTRDVAADGIRAELAVLRWPDAPEELRSLAMRAFRTKRAEDLYGLALAWLKHPDWAPAEASDLSLWRSQDRIDWQEQAGLRRRIGNARLDLYRCVVKRLVEQYGLIGVEDVDWRNIGRREAVVGKPNDIAMMTAQMRNLAAPGTLLMELRRAAQTAGARIHAQAGKSTWKCHICSIEQAPVDRAQLIHTCPACNSTWDQDINAARNLRAAVLASAPVLAPAPPPLAGSKRRKFRSLSQAGDERNGAGKAICRGARNLAIY